MLNTKSAREALGSVESRGLKAPKKYNDWKGVLKAIEQYHDPIAHHFYKAVGNELQTIDSQIVEMVLLELIKENTITLPVHDSFRYKIKDMQLLIKKMNVATKHYLGSELFSLTEVFLKKGSGLLSKVSRQSLRGCVDNGKPNHSKRKKIQLPEKTS